MLRTVVGTQEKVLARPANMPGMRGIPDMRLRVSGGVDDPGPSPLPDLGCLRTLRRNVPDCGCDILLPQVHEVAE